MAADAHMDVGDWVVVAFLFTFSVTGAVYIFKHPDPVVFGMWTGTLTVACGAFHWLRVRDSKIPDAKVGDVQ